MKPGQFIWNEHDSETWYNDTFDTFEECLKDAKASVDEDVDGVYIGQVKDFVPRVSAYRVLEDIAESAYEEAGEIAETYLDKICKEEEEELQVMLTETFNAWAKKNNHEPKFFTMDAIKYVSFNE